MAWYDAAHNTVTQDARDPMGSTAAYVSRNVGVDVLPTDSDVSATSGGIGVGFITISIPAGPGRCSAQVVVRPLTMTDCARYGGDSIANIDGTAADDATVYRPLARWLW